MIMQSYSVLDKKKYGNYWAKIVITSYAQKIAYDNIKIEIFPEVKVPETSSCLQWLFSQ